MEVKKKKKMLSTERYPAMLRLCSSHSTEERSSVAAGFKCWLKWNCFCPLSSWYITTVNVSVYVLEIRYPECVINTTVVFVTLSHLLLKIFHSLTKIKLDSQKLLFFLNDLNDLLSQWINGSDWTYTQVSAKQDRICQISINTLIRKFTQLLSVRIC